MATILASDLATAEHLRTRPAAAARTQDGARPILSIVVPTFNERDNVIALWEALEAALPDTPFEVVFVDDDSSDGTRELVGGLAQRNGRVRMLHRIGRRGLASAVTEGALSSTTPYIAVMDGDLQHDERILPQMIARVLDGGADLVVGSRYMDGGSIEGWDEGRARVSSLATRLAKLLIKTEISDPMSGYFVISRPAFGSAVRGLSGQGYKILLDICCSASRPLRIAEVPYQFRPRQAGESKLDSFVAWEYLMLLVEKTVGHIVPARFLSFMFIGGLGVFVHMLTLGLTMALLHPVFVVAQATATAVAMVFNFFVNNLLTYRDRRLRGVGGIAKGLATFVAACSIGALANVGIANYLFASHRYVWWAAGLAGILVGAVWNYAATSIFTWRSRGT